MPRTPSATPRRASPAPRRLLQHLVVLAGTEPLVWRRLQVPASYTLWDFHVAIQDAMGWFDAHLHEFRIPDRRTGTVARIGIPDEDAFVSDEPVIAGWTVRLDDVTGPYALPMQYVYDFGDDWTHTVVFEDFVQVPGRQRLRPAFVGGAGRCPPEDCGGVPGYRELLRTLADPTHPEHEATLAWTDGPIDPAAFDASAVVFSDPAKRWRQAFE